MSIKLALLFRRFGPYHCARLAAASSLGSVVGIEVSDADSTYAWESEPRGSLKIRTVLPGTDPQTVSRSRIARGVEATLQLEAPDCVAVAGWADPAALAALRWCARRQVPAILLAESSREDQTRSFVAEWIKGRIVRLCRTALVGGSRHKDYVVDLGLDPSLVWMGYDVVDNAYFDREAGRARAEASRERARLLLPERYWLASSRFIAKKNLTTVLRGYALYRGRVGAGAWGLVLVGDGPLRSALRAEAQSLDISEHLVMPGFRQYAELPAYYALAEGFVHASTVEQWGLVVNEAMATGLPVLVSSRCGCVPELVRPGYNGFSFDPLNVSELAEHMVTLHEMGPERLVLGANGKAIVAEWGIDRFATSLWAAARTAIRRPAPVFGPLDRAIVYGALQA
jgi:1,2-diacylglycerol 3-alpha-glucosyltransferase